jgi:glycosyltransferase involved in cell wall biosynthesis
MNKIIILLSTYNGAKYLKNQIDSLMSQSYDDFRIIARDDGSSDESLLILKSYDQIEIVDSQQNLGAKGSFAELLEYAVKHTDGEFFMFCDQDDVWKNDKIEKTLAKMQEMQCEYGDIPLLVHSDVVVVDDGLEVMAESFWKFQNIDPSRDALFHLLLQNVVTGCTMMINRKLANLVGKIPTEAIMHDWWIAMVASCFGKIGWVDEPLMFYRQHSSNDTGAKRYGLGYFVKRFVQKQSFEKYMTQAKVFGKLYDELLEERGRVLLNGFSKIDTMGWFEKRVFLLRWGVLKNGFVRNVGLMWKV